MGNYFEYSLLQPKTRYQLLATVLVSLITFGHGMGVGWLSPTLTKIQTPDSPLDFQKGIDEISWLGSMLGLGSLCGNLTMALLLERMGRKFCIYIMAGPYACMWILIYCASNVGYLYSARFLCGFTGGSGYLVIPIFISELADSTIRGTLTSLVMLSVNFGILAGFILSSHLDYYSVPCIAIALPIIYFLANLLLPETAPYLIKCGKFPAAETSYKYYQNRRHSTDQSYKADFEELRTAIGAQQALSTTDVSYKDLLTKSALKGFGAAFVLSMGHQFSGIFSFINYMSTIFEASGAILDVNTCTILIGMIQIVGVYTLTMFVDIVGRRILMLISTLGISLGSFAFGCFTYFAQSNDLSEYSWVPLLLMMSLIYLGNMGLNGLFFVVLVEVFPARIRSLATSISVVFLSGLVFCTLKLFPLELHYLGISTTMWVSASASFLTFLYFMLFLPETKGKSMIKD